MNRRIVLIALAGFGLLFGTAAAQDKMEEMKGFRGEWLGMFGHEADEVLQLADAMPADKYSWRPAEGVRSVSEVYMHVAGSNMFFASLIRGEEVNAEEESPMEKSVTDKADVRKQLAMSIDHVKEMVMKMSDSDLDKSVTIPFIPMTTTARGALLLVLSHIGEHLGQSIAYARMNGVTPPWSLPKEKDNKSGY